jgi:hypothetical protein
MYLGASIPSGGTFVTAAPMLGDEGVEVEREAVVGHWSTFGGG